MFEKIFYSIQVDTRSVSRRTVCLVCHGGAIDDFQFGIFPPHFILCVAAVCRCNRTRLATVKDMWLFRQHFS
jgi:hypothetical protein